MRRQIDFLVLDVDGTLTDGKVYMGESGELFKAFDIKDGCGIHDILPRYNIIPVIITARMGKVLKNRCSELGIKELYQGERDKLGCLLRVLKKYSENNNSEYKLENVAYIGDDIIDLQCMESVKKQGGIVGCPADAVKDVQAIADFISDKNGGNGAVRDFIEYIVR